MASSRSYIFFSRPTSCRLWEYTFSMGRPAAFMSASQATWSSQTAMFRWYWAATIERGTT